MFYNSKTIGIFVILSMVLITLSACTSNTDNNTPNVEQSDSLYQVNSESLDSMVSDAIQTIDEAALAAGRSDASFLNNACKTVYSAIRSGSITNSSKNNDGSYVDFAADEGASREERENAAKNVSVDDVQRYNGTSMRYNDMVYVVSEFNGYSVGTILYEKDPVLNGYENCVKQFDSKYVVGPFNDKNNTTTTLGDLYK